MADQMLKWVHTSSTTFATLNKDPNTLYFLNDTKEIYKGDTAHTEAVVLVNDFPQTGIAKNKLYIKSTTLEGKTFDGTDWHTVFRPVSNTLSDEDDTNDNDLITGAGIKLYVSERLADIVAEGGITAKTTKLAEAIDVKGVTMGSYKDGDSIPADANIWTVIRNLLQTAIPATYTKPTLTVSLSNSSVEAGTSVNPTITPTFTKNDGGDLTKYTLTRTDNNGTTTVVDATSATAYTQDSIVVTDSNLKYVATANYAEGLIKNNNLGEPSPDGHITAGSTSVTRTYTAYRKAFWGSEVAPVAEGATKPVAITTSDDIRSLSSNSNGATKTGTDAFSVVCNTGDNRVTIAYPATIKDITGIKSTGLGGMSVLGVFNKTTVDVEGADGFSAISYKVYTYIPDAPFPTGDTYVVSI